MKAGEDAGLAPRVWYTSIEDRVSITDFVNAKPFPKATALEKLPETIRRLHALPPFPRTANYLEVMDGFISRLQAGKILPESETADAFELYAKAREAYPRDDADMVSSHNDLKPENVLFDGERVWLVDWEAGFLNDRYLDLSVVGNFLVTNEEEEKTLLRRYFAAGADGVSTGTILSDASDFAHVVRGGVLSDALLRFPRRRSTRVRRYVNFEIFTIASGRAKSVWPGPRRRSNIRGCT